MHLEPNILECEVKRALEKASLMDKGSGGDGIPVELFQIPKDDAVKVRDKICQQIWKTQQWPGSSDSKESTSSAEDMGSIPQLGRSPGGGHATHSSILAWRIPWTL